MVSLWPAMAIMVDLNRVGHPPGIRYPMFELVRDNILIAKNADRIVLGQPEGTDSPPIGLRLRQSESTGTKQGQPGTPSAIDEGEGSQIAG